MSYYELPIYLQRDIENIFDKVRNEVEKESDLIRIVFDDDLKIKIEHNDFKSNFFFQIHNPAMDNQNRISYQAEFKPTSVYKPTTTKTNIISNKEDFVIKKLKSWINLIKAAKSFKPHKKDKIINEYKERFFKSFEFLDDEDGDEILSFADQRQLSTLIDNTIKLIGNDENIDDDILDDLKLLNASIKQLTKKQIRNSLSWIFAKMYYKGIDVVNWTAQEGSKAGFGYILVEGVRNALLL